MKNLDSQREVIERADWLRLARRQSQVLAGSREELQIPLRWEVPQETSGRAFRRPLRLSWAMVLLPALILGGATGTWAFVRHLQLQDPTPAPLPLPVKPSLSSPPQRPEQPQARRMNRAAPQAEPVAAVKPDPPPRRVMRKAARVKKAAAAPAATAATASRPATVVPTQVVGEDQVIIVSPPAKMKPLWSVESYKKRRGRASTPHR